MKKLFLYNLILVLSFFLIQASAQFYSDYEITYKINELGETKVSQKIKLTNKNSDVIATKYYTNIREIKTFNEKILQDGKEYSMIKEEKDNKILLIGEIKNPAIGKGKSNNFTIEYSTYDIISKVGDVYSLNIPKFAIPSDTNSYKVKVSIPLNFGPEINMSPNPENIIKEKDEIIYIFDLKDENTGITGSFGKYQILNFKLDYILKNNSKFTTIKSIALPPDIKGVQQVTYKNLNPVPKKIYLDKDENYIAEYKLKPNEKINIRLIGTAKILGNKINVNNGGKFNEIENSLVENYTKSDIYWEVDHEKIRKIANELYDENLNVIQNSKKIYDYVISNLKYDFDILSKTAVKRKGAISSLEYTQGTGCMEFTDLYISISRAMGIPAREINGYAVALEPNKFPLSINLKGGDVLHSWVEFYDPNLKWIQIDPTWGSTSGLDYFTKLDTNHFTFVRKGINSQKPLPAGIYKDTGEEKQIEVSFSSEQEKYVFNPTIKLYKKKVNLFSNNTYKVENLGTNTIYIKNNLEGNEFIIALPVNNLRNSKLSEIKIPKDQDTIEIYDALNKKKVVNLTEVVVENNSKLNYLILVASMPLLYMTYRFLRARLKYR